MIKGVNIYLRQVEPEDVDMLYNWENDVANWKVSETLVPFSKKTISDYVFSSHDIYSTKQLRLIICLNDSNLPIGAIDLFDYDSKNSRAGVGILIVEEYRKNGYATDALRALISYAKETLILHQIYCSIGMSNTKSIQLFEKAGFVQTGIKKDWVKTSNGWEDVGFFQKVLRD